MARQTTAMARLEKDMPKALVDSPLRGGGGPLSKKNFKKKLFKFVAAEKLNIFCLR